MTAEEFRAARIALGLSANSMARILGVTDGKTIRRWVAGEREVSGSAAVLVRALLDSAAVREHFGVTLKPQDAS